MNRFYLIESGYFFVDGGAMFGPIPKKYWSRKYPCDARNICVMAMRSLLVDTGNRKIIIDTGAGDKHLAQLKFYQPHRLKNMTEAVEEIGFAPEDITDVVLTHLHFDHCGGSTYVDDNQRLSITFPRATHWISRAQWENYKNPCGYERDSFFAENIEPVFDVGKLQLIDDDMLLCESVRLQLYDGHTPGQIAVFIDTDTEKIVFPADVVPTSAHVSLGWLSAYDNHAALAMDEKKRFLIQAFAENRTLIFCHDAHTVSGKVKANNGGFYFEKSQRPESN